MSRRNLHLISSKPRYDALKLLQDLKCDQFLEQHPSMTAETFEIFSYTFGFQEFQTQFGPDSDYISGDYNIHNERVKTLPDGFSGSYIRSIYWRVFFQTFNSTYSPYHWPSIIIQQRQHYDELTIRYQLPIDNINCTSLPSTTAITPDNINEYVALCDTIKLDLIRTFPSCGFYTHQDVQDQLLNILYLFCCEHQEGYKQGMNELAAFLLYAVTYDSLNTKERSTQLISKINKHGLNNSTTASSTPSTSTTSTAPSSKSIQDDTLLLLNNNNNNPTTMQEKLEVMEFAYATLVDRDYIIHDTYTLFCAIMKNMGQYYSIKAAALSQTTLSISGQNNNSNDNKDKQQVSLSSRSGVSAQNNPQDKSSTKTESEPPIVVISHHIFHQLLPIYDPDLYRHLNNIDVIPTLFLLRWVRLLLSREYASLDECAVLHDQLFATAQNDFSLLPYLALAMLHLKRDDLLEQEDTAGAFEFLLRAAQNDWWSDDEDEDEENNNNYNDNDENGNNIGLDSDLIIVDTNDDGNNDNQQQESSETQTTSTTTATATTTTTTTTTTTPTTTQSTLNFGGIESDLFDATKHPSLDDSLFDDDVVPQRTRGSALSLELDITKSDNKQSNQNNDNKINDTNNEEQQQESTIINDDNDANIKSPKSPKQKRIKPLTVCKRPDISDFPRQVVLLALKLSQKQTQLPKTGKPFTTQQLTQIRQHHANMSKLPSESTSTTTKSSSSKLNYSGTDYDRSEYGSSRSHRSSSKTSDSGGLFGFVSKIGQALEGTPKQKSTPTKSSTSKLDKRTTKSSQKDNVKISHSQQYELNNDLFQASPEHEQAINLVTELISAFTTIVAPYQSQIESLQRDRNVTLSSEDIDSGVKNNENINSNNQDSNDSMNSTISRDNIETTTTPNSSLSIENSTSTTTQTPPPTTTTSTESTDTTTSTTSSSSNEPTSLIKQPSTFNNTSLTADTALNTTFVPVSLSELILLQDKLQLLESTLTTLSAKSTTLILPTDDYFSTRFQKTSKEQLDTLGTTNIYARANYDAGGGFPLTPGQVQTNNKGLFDTKGFNPTRIPTKDVLMTNDVGLDGIDLSLVLKNNTKLNHVDENSTTTTTTSTTTTNDTRANTTEVTSTPTQNTPKVTPVTSPTTTKPQPPKSTNNGFILSSQVASMSLFDDDDDDILTVPVVPKTIEKQPQPTPTRPQEEEEIKSTPTTIPTTTTEINSTPTPKSEEVAPVKVVKPLVPNEKGLLFGDDDSDDDTDIFKTAIFTKRTQAVVEQDETLTTNDQQKTTSTNTSTSTTPKTPQVNTPSTQTTTKTTISSTSTTITKKSGLFDDDDIFEKKEKLAQPDLSDLFG